MSKAMYPVRVASSVSLETERRLNEASEKLSVPVAHIIREGIELRVAQLLEDTPKESVASKDVHDLMEARERFGLLLDAVDGVKADMETRGWPPEMAQGVALTWFLGVTGMKPDL
ncbi:ribbon-helix-helix domain-containing protein [Streptomyces ossamyceticus]|uniref:Ribbon-helix-helix domain-containing protein n=1 Tax=Streptomyces ossamyceticus TaxID=249581 RepID=A0ABV2V4Y8_9ACTN